jgi:hypothetical protein
MLANALEVASEYHAFDIIRIGGKYLIQELRHEK